MDCLEDVKRGLAPRKKRKGVGVKSVLKGCSNRSSSTLYSRVLICHVNKAEKSLLENIKLVAGSATGEMLTPSAEIALSGDEGSTKYVTNLSLLPTSFPDASLMYVSSVYIVC